MGGDRGNVSGSIRLVWGKLLEEMGARRGWPVDLGRVRGAEQGHGTAGGAGGAEQRSSGARWKKEGGGEAADERAWAVSGGVRDG